MHISGIIDTSVRSRSTYQTQEHWNIWETRHKHHLQGTSSI